MAGLDGNRWGIIEAELFAILIGLWLCHPQPGNRGWNSIDIFTDSQSSLHRLNSSWSEDCKPLRHLTMQIRQEITLLQSRFKIPICFWWIPGHSGIAGNKEVDKLAKEATKLQDTQPKPPYSSSKVREWSQKVMIAFNQQTWRLRASGSLFEVNDTFHQDNWRTFNSLSWRLTWLLLKFCSCTLPVASHQGAKNPGEPLAKCKCDAPWQDREHLLFHCNMVDREQRFIQRHFPPALRTDIRSILSGATFGNDQTCPAYLANLECFLNACMRVLRHTCDKNGVYNKAHSYLSNASLALTERPLTFLPDSPPPVMGETTTARASPPNGHLTPTFATGLLDPPLYLNYEDSDTKDMDDNIDSREESICDVLMEEVARPDMNITTSTHIFPGTPRNGNTDTAQLRGMPSQCFSDLGTEQQGTSNPVIAIVSDSDDDSVEFLGLAD